MTDEVKPPEGDEAQDRHRFYAQVASAINSNTQALERAFGVIKRLEETMQKQNELLTRMETTAKVVMAILVFTTGGMGWYINRVVSSADVESARVEKHDRMLELHDIILKQQQPITDQLNAIKSRLTRVEDELERKK